MKQTGLRHIIMVCVWFSAAMLPAQPRERVHSFIDYLRSLPTERLTAMGDAYYNTGRQPDSAFCCYQVAANRLPHAKDKEEQLQCASALRMTGVLYQYHYYNYLRAYSIYLTCNRLAVEEGYSRLLSSTYIDLANIYIENGTLRGDEEKVQTALRYYRKAFRIAMDGDDNLKRLYVFNMVKIAWSQGALDSISREIDEYLHAVRQEDIGRTLCLAARQYAAGHLEASLSLLDKALDIPPPTPTGMEERYTFMLLELKGKVLLQLGRNREYLDNVARLMDLAQDYHLVDGKLDVYRYYADYYRRTGDRPNADRYQMEYLLLKDTIYTENRLADIENAEFMLQLDDANEEIAQGETQRRQLRTVLLLISALLIFAITTLAVVIRHSIRIRRKNRQLYQSNLSLMEAEQNMKQLLSQKPPKAVEEDDDDESEEVLYKVFCVMETSPEIFEKGFNMEALCRLTGCKEYRLSRAINRRYGSFYTLLNEYRIKEACRRMNDTAAYGHYTIEAIADSVGFGRSHFIRTFKKQVGLTPSQYLKMAREDKNTNL